MNLQQISEIIKKQQVFFHFPKFVLVGILNTIVGYGAFYILSNYVYYLIALVISHIIGVINSYIWNKYWVFKVKSLNIVEFLKFNVVYLFVFIINAIALFVCVSILYIDPKIGQLIILPLVTITSYFGQKYFSFRLK